MKQINNNKKDLKLTDFILTLVQYLFFILIPRHAQLVSRGCRHASLLNGLTNARLDQILKQVSVNLMGDVAMRSDHQTYTFNRVRICEAFVEASIFGFQVDNTQMTVAEHVSILTQFLINENELSIKHQWFILMILIYVCMLTENGLRQ